MMNKIDFKLKIYYRFNKKKYNIIIILKRNIYFFNIIINKYSQVVGHRGDTKCHNDGNKK